MKKLFLFMILIVLVSGCGEEKKKEETPKIDNSDLVCTAVMSDSDNYKEKIIITISFDENAVITQYSKKYSYTYLDEVTGELKEGEGKPQITQIDKTSNYYGKTKQEMKDIYINFLYYTCD